MHASDPPVMVVAQVLESLAVMVMATADVAGIADTGTVEDIATAATLLWILLPL